ncbi:SDR family NAD(P)-dependent oxidoreductase [Oceanobacter mangrovi]|uniref:SDR family NAD(P)-dependent oxidoreductase n=1 Tax=Oceanobacter mangrovi TaxID=2862510 RepID=UPI001C8D44A0|nr:SDR family oxidoreductase [Oceanobacter mangrovi]
MNKNNRLEGKVAIVTGSGSGIGRGCALMFAAAGAQVVGADINATTAAETEQLAAEQGTPIRSLAPCDLTNPDDVQKLIDFCIEQYGRLDILVNAGAFGAFAWLEEMDYYEGWKRTLDGELSVVFLACQKAWPHLKQSGAAAIINFASANAHNAFKPLPAIAHCAGKGGVLAMSRQLAMEGREFNIRVNTISPALIETTATREPLENIPGFRDEVLAKTMIKRLGQPEDIGYAAIYLASDEASWVTGADLPVDGGSTAW